MDRRGWIWIAVIVVVMAGLLRWEPLALVLVAPALLAGGISARRHSQDPGTRALGAAVIAGGATGVAILGRLAEQARANDPDHYAEGFESVFSASVVERVLKNQDVFLKIQADPRFRKLVMDYLRHRVYERQLGEASGG